MREIRCQFAFSGKNDELTPDFPTLTNAGHLGDDVRPFLGLRDVAEALVAQGYSPPCNARVSIEW